MIEDPKENLMTLALEGKEVGRLTFNKKGKLTFIGDADKSAQSFFDSIIRVYDEKVVGLVEELEAEKIHHNDAIKAQLEIMAELGRKVKQVEVFEAAEIDAIGSKP